VGAGAPHHGINIPSIPFEQFKLFEWFKVAAMLTASAPGGAGGVVLRLDMPAFRTQTTIVVDVWDIGFFRVIGRDLSHACFLPKKEGAIDPTNDE
jgi:hypothetical protein